MDDIFLGNVEWRLLLIEILSFELLGNLYIGDIYKEYCLGI